MSPFFGQNLSVLDDSGVQQLIGDDPVEYGTTLEGAESRTRSEETFFGLTVEKLRVVSYEAELDATTQTSDPFKKGDSSYEKRKSIGDEMFLEGGRPFKIVAFEISDRSEEKIIAVPAGSGTVSGVRSLFSSGGPDRTLTEFGLSELEAMAKQINVPLFGCWLS